MRVDIITVRAKSNYYRDAAKLGKGDWGGC